FHCVTSCRSRASPPEACSRPRRSRRGCNFPPPMSAMGLGCVKSPTLAARVEPSRRNCIPERQLILHTRGVVPYWSIGFSTTVMSFYTARVISDQAGRSHAIMHVRFAPKADKQQIVSVCPLCAMCGRLQVGKAFLHVCRLVGAAMCSAYLRG